MAQTGVAVALVASFVAVGFAWREVKLLSTAHRDEVKSLLTASQEIYNRQHREALEMLDRFDERANHLNATVQRLNAQLGAAHSELATMRGNNVWLRGEVAERQAKVDALEAKIVELEAARDAAAEAAAREAEETTANLVALPTCGGSTSDLLPTAEDLWSDGDHPTVVDLGLLSLPEMVDERKQA